jgi:DNA-binding LacI/PurR family transcriptional regulator
MILNTQYPTIPALSNRFVKIFDFFHFLCHYGTKTLGRNGTTMTEESVRPTLEDIAQAINISRTTIYKVINNKGAVSGKTRQRIEEALEKYKYVSNRNARNLAMNRRHALAFVYFESSNAAYFASSVRRGIRQAWHEYGDHGLAVTDSATPQAQPERQIAAIKKAFGKGVRYFAVAAADPAPMADCLNWLAERDCTVVLISKDVPGAARSAFIGIDERQCGRLAAELMAKMLRPGDAVRVLRASDNSFSTRERFVGFREEMERHPEIELLPNSPALSGGTGIARTIPKILSDPRVKGIMDLTYKLDLVATEIQKAGRRDLRLVGVDLSPEIVPFLDDGTIAAVIYQNIQQQAFLACRVLFEEMCYGAAVTGQQPVKLEIVMKNNIPAR